ncbi:MAG: hypothetical protein N3A66_11390, partial [Planctomycetota bacterium]|nr:hypothetical protein [Planctomycetota bacterium]
MAGRFLAEAKAAQSPLYRGTLLDLLCDLPLSPTMSSLLLSCAVEVLTQLPDDAPAVRGLERWLMQIGDQALQALALRLPACDIAHQRHFLRFFDNALRSLSLQPATREIIGQAAAEILRCAPKQVRSDLIETCLLIQPDLSPELRRQIASALLRDFRDYLATPYRDCLINILAALGPPAVELLLLTLREQCHTDEAGVIATALGRLGAALAAAAKAPLAEDILRELQKILYRQPACGDDILLAMGRICREPSISPAAARVIFRAVFQHVRGTAADGPAIEALGLICSGPGPDENDVRQVVDLALRQISEHAAIGYLAGDVTATTVAELTAAADIHGDVTLADVPVAQ